MRPKPLIATLTAIFSSSLLAKRSNNLRRNLAGRQAEIVEQCFCRGGCSKAVDAKTQTIQTCIAFPAESRPRLNGYFERIGGKQVGFVSSLLRIEKRQARHGHHIRANPLRFMGVSATKREFDFRAAGAENNIARQNGSAEGRERG